jgi:hypothetical protein
LFLAAIFASRVDFVPTSAVNAASYSANAVDISLAVDTTAEAKERSFSEASSALVLSAEAAALAASAAFCNKLNAAFVKSSCVYAVFCAS